MVKIKRSFPAPQSLAIEKKKVKGSYREADVIERLAKDYNSACEGFFGRMKNEMFYGEKWDKISVEEFISIINQYMQWYRDKRIKLSLGGLSPMEYRRSLGIA